MESLQTTYLKLLQNFPKGVVFCSLLGFLLIFSKAFKTLLFLYKNFLRKSKDLAKRYGEKSWVLITGSSDGIGKAFAHSFAHRGFNVVLCARTKSKLEIVQQELKQINPNIRVKIVVMDFKESNQPGFFDFILDQVKDLDISVLINNVGVDVLSPYHELTQQEIKDLITINCVPVAVLNHRFIPRFLKRPQKSAIVNVGSVAGEIPMALHNVYSASKAFVNFFSSSMNYQYPEIDIINLRPSEVSTPMTCNKAEDILTISPRTCAEGLLRDMGYETGSNGPISHKLQSILYSYLPEGLFNYVFKNFIGPDFIRERKAAQSKRQKTQ